MFREYLSTNNINPCGVIYTLVPIINVGIHLWTG